MLAFVSCCALALCLGRYARSRPGWRYDRAAVLSVVALAGYGGAHLLGALAPWWPIPGIRAALDMVVALVAIAAATAIWRIVPDLARRPTPEEIEESRAESRDLRAHEAELNDALERLRRADRAKTDFLAAMSHDLRTPLNAILGFSETLKLGIFGALANARQAEYVDHIRSSGAQLLTLINDLLDLSGVENGARNLRPGPIRARPMLEDIVRQFEMSSVSQDRRVHVDLTCAVADVYADETSFRRIIDNLLSNAAKYGGGTITLDATEGRRGVEIRVTDEGPGFPEDRIDAMRAPFARERGSDDGIGIGLAIVDTLMQHHRGYMALSNAPRGGARITLCFPFAPPVREVPDVRHPGRRALARRSDERPPAAA